MATEGTKIVLVVEGDLDDHFFDQAIDDSGRVEIVIGRGKGRISDVLSELLACPDPILVLLDRDYDEILDLQVDDERLVYTDRYNLEAELLTHVDLFDALWRVHSRRDYSKVPHTKVRGACTEIAHEIGLLRLASMLGDHGLRLAGLPIHEVVTEGHLPNVDRDLLVGAVVKRSKDSALWERTSRRHSHALGKTEAGCKKRLHKEAGQCRRGCPPEVTASGHDMSMALNLILRRLRKNGIPSAVDLEWQAAGLFRDPMRRSAPFIERIELAAAKQGFSTLLSWPA